MSEGNLYKIDNCMQNETHHKYMPKNNTSSELESEIEEFDSHKKITKRLIPVLKTNKKNYISLF